MIYIFGFSYCPYYKNAIQLCKDKKLEYKSFDSEKFWNKILQTLKPKIGIHKSSHIIFENKQFIGGFEQLKLKKYS